jgi:hypothetical protein
MNLIEASMFRWQIPVASNSQRYRFQPRAKLLDYCSTPIARFRRKGAEISWVFFVLATVRLKLFQFLRQGSDFLLGADELKNKIANNGAGIGLHFDLLSDIGFIDCAESIEIRER